MKRVFVKKLSAAFLALVMLVSLVPAASAASTSSTITYEVDADDYVMFDVSKFDDLLYYNSSSWNEEVDYLEFTSYSGLDRQGYICAEDKNGTEQYLTEDDLYYAKFYQDSRYVTGSNKYCLDGMNFEADEDANDTTLDLRFKLHGDRGTTVNGTLRINIDGDGYGYSYGDIEYEVRPNGSVDFSASDFNAIFKEEYPSYSAQYVQFDTPSSSDYATGTVYYRYGKSSEDYFTRTELDDYTFYCSSSSYGDYALNDLSFVADRDFDDDVTLTFTVYGSGNRYVEGTVTFTTDGSGSGSGSGDGDINYDADSGDKVTFKKSNFKDYYDDCKNANSSSFSYVTFDYAENLDDNGKLYAYDYYDDSIRIYEDEVDEYYFYNSVNSMRNDDTDLYLDGMYYKVNNNADDVTVTLDFTVHGTSSRDKWDGTLTITIGNGGDGTTSSKKGDINYKAEAGEETTIDAEDFNDYFQKTYSSYDIKYVTFTDATGLSTSNGSMYVDYGYRGQKKFGSASSLDGIRFYYDEDAYEDAYDNDEDCYLLDDLSFVAASGFKTPVELEFTAYYSSSRKVTGTVVFGDSAAKPIGNYYVGSIRYNTTAGNNVQIKAEDIARFFTKNCPGVQMQYVVLTGVPATGSLWYNYYGASKYGSAKGQITSWNASGQVFYASPTATNQYALTELTYVPSGSNYCAAIPFTAVGNSRSVSGAILIGVTSKAVGEVYGVTTKGAAITFPSNTIYSAVLNATGQAPASIQLLNLPSYVAGAVYEGNNYDLAATTKHYTFGTGSDSVGQLRFIPSAGYTGSVEVPYVALNSAGVAIASGMYSIGVVSAKKTFKDVSASTWCYKYVTELSDAGVIGGYPDGSFKPDTTVTYGAALKLAMLAAGYPEQKPVNSNVFSGYLAKAKADGLVSGNIDLSKPITRLQMAQLAAKAMKLSTTGLSTVKPFTDTTDPYVQALNAAGIIGGYFANGTSTYKPNNNLTRGQASAIVWRMENYTK